MESKKLPGKIFFVIFLINLIKEYLSDIIVKSPHQLAVQFTGILKLNHI
jgi:hypothetical protein